MRLSVGAVRCALNVHEEPGSSNRTCHIQAIAFERGANELRRAVLPHTDLRIHVEVPPNCDQESRKGDIVCNDVGNLIGKAGNVNRGDARGHLISLGMKYSR